MVEQALSRAGYFSGLRQPGYSMALTVARPGRLRLEAVDAFIAAAFGEDAAWLPAQQNPPGNDHAAFLAWIERALWVAVLIQNAARLAVFEPARIVAVDPVPGQPSDFKVLLAAPSVDFVPLKYVVAAHQSAVTHVKWATDHYPTRSDLEPLLRNLETKVVNPLRALFRPGISTMPILREAFRQGIPSRHLGAGVFQLGWGRQARRLDRSALDVDSAIGGKMAQRKDWTAQVLRSAGLPVPKHFVVSSEEHALQAAEELAWRVVVKPADRDRSEGVTIGVRQPEQLGAAYRAARQLSRVVLVEREVPGECYRLMVASGAFLYAVRRWPKSVVGDAVHSVAALILQLQAENRKRPPWGRSKDIELDAATLGCLARQGLHPPSVPAEGQRVFLRDVESAEWGGDVEDATAEVHAENAAVAVRAARFLGLSNAGVDIISTDISRPWFENGAVINEMNFAPHFGATTAARARMAQFLQRLMSGDGRIPVEVFIGADKALAAARDRQRQLAASGLPHHVTTHERTWAADETEMRLDSSGLFDRSLALFMDRDVQGLILVVQNDELLHSGLPMDRVDRVHACDLSDDPGDGQGARMSGKSRQRLLELLTPYRRASN